MPIPSTKTSMNDEASDPYFGKLSLLRSFSVSCFNTSCLNLRISVSLVFRVSLCVFYHGIGFVKQVANNHLDYLLLTVNSKGNP
jgi:hypothetical protein